jgi:CheY-like chemotaxis protein
MAKKKIIFIDDDRAWSRPFVDELEKAYTVLYRRTAVAGRDAVSEHVDTEVLILDIMMPPPSEDLESETERGLATGIWLLEQVRKTILERPLPVIVLTNRIFADVERRLADAGIPTDLLEVRSKMDTPRFYIPHLVGEMIDRARKRKR